MDGNVRCTSLPDKNAVLKEHLFNMEFPPVESEVLDMKLILFHRTVCDKIDKKAPPLMKESLLANTANYK